MLNITDFSLFYITSTYLCYIFSNYIYFINILSYFILKIFITLIYFQHDQVITQEWKCFIIYLFYYFLYNLHIERFELLLLYRNIPIGIYYFYNILCFTFNYF